MGAMHLFDSPTEIRPLLAAYGWGDDGTRLTLDEVDLAGKILGGATAAWSDRIVAAVNLTMPRTTGVGYLDDEANIIGIGLLNGHIAGSASDEMVTDLSRADACFAMRAFDEGYARVRPMVDLPVAIIHEALPSLAAAAAAAPVEVPENAKVFIEVDPENQSVVYDVWAVAPSDGVTTVGIWRRHAGKWESDPGFFSALKGEQPPALLYMPIDAPILGSVLTQVDAATQTQPFEPITADASTIDPMFFVDMMPLIAAGNRGGLKRAAGVGKGGNAETLRRYWAEGKGAAKIRWGQGGDFYRCVKHLRKYMGVRSKGYCNLIHKRALGYYPSTHAKMVRDAKRGVAASADQESSPVW